jgi:hypothetical protein
VTILDNGVFALTEGVPQLDGAVWRSGDNLSVVGKRRQRTRLPWCGRRICGDLPKEKGSIPRSGQTELTIRTDHNVGDEVVVATKSTTSIAVVVLFAGQGQ